MKILIADLFPAEHIELLEQSGHTVSHDPTLESASLSAAVSDHEVLIVRSTRVDSRTLDAGTALKLVIRAGAGSNTIDKSHAAERKIAVCNVPGANSIAVAELVMGLIISIDRRIPDNVSDLKGGIWNKKTYSRAKGLYGRKLGILGLGAIGMAVCQRAGAFGMQVHAVHKAGRRPEIEQWIADAGIIEHASQEALVSACDIVSLHMPANEQTTGMVDDRFLGMMQDDGILINTSRGELVDESALIRAMDTRGIRAGLDVYVDEPGAGDTTFGSALSLHPGVTGTHHIGASTRQAQTAVADGVLSVIRSHETGDLINRVN